MTIIFDNTGFSIEYWGRFTESEFVEQGMKQRFYKQHPDDKRRELLKLAYQIMQHDITRNAATTKSI